MPTIPLPDINSMERERTARLLNCSNCDNFTKVEKYPGIYLSKCKLKNKFKNEWEMCKKHSVIVNSLK